jgi:LacI family transcriptional regulator
MGSKRRPTMLDVARLAGTSKATVSNVLQGHENVRPSTRDRVLAAIEGLDYRVHLGARSLARQESNVLGILLGDLENPWYATVAAHMERVARSHGYSVLMASTGGESLRDDFGQAEALRLANLVEHRVAAIIMNSFSGDATVMHNVPTSTPVVFVDNQGPGTTVTVDSRLGSHLAVSHLLELGHRRIGYVSTNSDTDPIADDDRFSSYRQSLGAAGCLADSDGLVVRLQRPPASEADLSGMQIAIDALLTRSPRPTAIFASSDLTAIEVLDRADALGLDVPRDLSIVGFDDIKTAGLKRISLTTIAQPAVRLATTAVETAIALSRGVNTGIRPLTLLAPNLVVRATTGVAPREGGDA